MSTGRGIVTRMPKPIKTKSGRTLLPVPRMEGETESPAKARRRRGRAFVIGGKVVVRDDMRALKLVGRPIDTAHATNMMARALPGHARQHSDGEVPGQIAVGDYEILFRENNPRAKPRKYEAEGGGSWGIYLRDYNVRVATFADNSDHLREALSRMFDAAHALNESAKKSGNGIRGIIARSEAYSPPRHKSGRIKD